MREDIDEADGMEPSLWFKEPLELPLEPPKRKDSYANKKSVIFEPSHFTLGGPQSESKVEAKREGRKVREIEISTERMYQRFKAKRGLRSETKNISRHIMNTMWRQLRLLVMTGQLSETDSKAVVLFGRKGCRNADLPELWQRQQVRQKISKWTSSGQFVKSLMGSSVGVKGKITFVKYLQKTRQMILAGSLSGWKEQTQGG